MSRKRGKKRGAAGTADTHPPPPSHRDLISEWADNLVFAGTLLILFLRPFISGRTYPQYNHFFHIGVGLLSILWLVKCLKKGKLELHNRLLTGFVCAFLLVCSFTFFTTINKGVTLRYIYEILSYTLLFLVIANNFREGSLVKAAVATILASALLVNLYGLYQRYYSLEMTRRHIEAILESGNQDMLMGIPLGTGILHRLEGTRVFSTFLYPNAYAMFLGIVGAITVGWLWSTHRDMIKFAKACQKNVSGRNSADRKSSKAEKTATSAGRLFKGIGGLLLVFMFLVSCILIPWNLWLTYSRGGWAGAIVIVLVFVVVAFWNRKIPREKIGVLVLMAVLLATMLPSAEAFSADKVSVHEVSFFSRLKDSLTVVQRLSYWRGTLAMIEDNPWLGVGWGAFEKAYPRYMILGGYPVKLAHNNYLQVWAETGIVGLNAFVGLWLVFLYTFWQKVRPEATSELRGIACGLGAGVIGFLANSLIDFAFYLPTLAYLVFALLGLLVAVPTRPQGEDKFSFRFPRLVGAILIMLICAYLWFLCKSYAGLRLSIRAKEERTAAFPTRFARDRGFDANPELQRKTLRHGIPLLKESIRYFPLDADSHYMLGDSYVGLARMEKAPLFLSEAIKQLERAAELNPWSPYVFQSLAAAYWAAGNATGQSDMFEKALRAEQQASENFPVNPGFHDKLVQIYNALGLKEEATKEARLAKELRKHYREF